MSDLGGDLLLLALRVTVVAVVAVAIALALRRYAARSSAVFLGLSLGALLLLSAAALLPLPDAWRFQIEREDPASSQVGQDTSLIENPVPMRVNRLRYGRTRFVTSPQPKAVKRARKSNGVGSSSPAFICSVLASA